MKAITVKIEKDEPQLRWQDAPAPVITRDEVLVDVQATAVNSVPIWASTTSSRIFWQKCSGKLKKKVLT
ncbi:MAG: hypothetical protein JRF72_06535 [Deltaproteobacteria bacterium]|nr:hypothetical protein [Deltaproteobacteria bacterium]